MSNELSRREIDRRNLLRVGAGTAAAAGLLGLPDLNLADGMPRATASTDGVDEVDYVIVGSGPGGSPLAANLVEAGFQVLVLEAGPPSGDKIWYDVPAYQLMAASADKQIRWDFWCQRYSDTTYNRTCSQWRPDQGGILYPRASTLGGCTAHNTMITMYPEHSDWAYIQKLTGDDTWDPEKMWGHWERFLSWQKPEFYPLSDVVKIDPQIGKMTDALIYETQQLPGGDVGDRYGINSRKNVDASAQGFMLTQQATRQGVRYGPRERLLEAQRANPGRLTIFTDALAERIILEPGSGGRQRAVGVEYLRGRHLYGACPSPQATAPAERDRIRQSVRVRKEVIVAGGTYNSPQLLMLSGIGPRDHLAQHGIPVRVDLPAVGTNLQDRYEVPIVSKCDPLILLALCKWGKRPDPCQGIWEASRGFGLSGMGFYSTNGVLAGLKRRYGADKRAQMYILGTPTNFRGYVPEFHKGYGNDHWTWLTLKGFSESNIGTVRLRSADPTAPPTINFRNFSDGTGGDNDVKAIIDSMQMMRRVNKRAATGSTEIWPGPQVSDDPAQLEKFIRKEAWGHHASCTNPIGPESDRKSVLDSRFRVHGTENLRVVDASAFPRIPGLFIWAPVAMLSEKATKDILEDAGKRPGQRLSGRAF